MDFSESFPLHERTYKYHSQVFNLIEDVMSTTTEVHTRLECERCDFFEETTATAMMKGHTMIQPLYIQTKNTHIHYLLCPSCRLWLKGKVRRWVEYDDD